MSIINSKDCTLSRGNTGRKVCFNDIGIPRGIIYGATGQTLDATSIAVLKTALEEMLLADNPNARAYPLQNITTITDNTATPVKQTSPADGSVIVTAEPPYDLTFEWIDQGFCLLHNMRKSNGQRTPFMLFDQYANLIATKVDDNTIGFIPAYNYTNPLKFATTQQAVAVYSTELVFDTHWVNEDIAIISFTNDGGLAYLQGLNGLNDVVLKQGAARALGVLKVTAFTDCDSQNLFDTYAADLAVVGAWKARNKATKKPIPVTAAAQDAVNLGWTVTVDTANANYSTAANSIEVSLAGPTELAALDVVGYESNWLTQ